MVMIDSKVNIKISNLDELKKLITKATDLSNQLSKTVEQIEN